MFSTEKNNNSHLTVKDRKTPSLPVRSLHEKCLLKGNILDFGCGLGKDLEFLLSNNYNAIGYDIYYKPEFPNQKFDTIICFYVLNVLLPEEQTQVLMQISELLKPTGKAYFAVRRDIKRNGFLYNPKKDAKTYQCNVILPYKSIFRNENMEIYEYQHYTTINGIFQNNLITESATAFSILKNENSAFIFPKKKVLNFFELSEKEQFATILVLNKTKKILENKLNIKEFEVNFLKNESKHFYILLSLSTP